MRWLVVFFTSACATVVPMQTASVVPRGTVRVGGSLSAAAYCGDLRGGVVLGLTSCTEYPDGIPFPEARANARLGVGNHFDLGVSLQGSLQVLAPERAGQLGATVDVKRELFRVRTGEVTHLVSTGLLGAAAIAGRFSLPLWTQTEWGVPLFYGVQLGAFELVVSASVSNRRLVRESATPFVVDSTRVHFAVGLFRTSSWAVQLGYLTDPARFLVGSTQLQFGWFFDLR